MGRPATMEPFERVIVAFQIAVALFVAAVVLTLTYGGSPRFRERRASQPGHHHAGAARTAR